MFERFFRFLCVSILIGMVIIGVFGCGDDDDGNDSFEADDDDDQTDDDTSDDDAVDDDSSDDDDDDTDDDDDSGDDVEDVIFDAVYNSPSCTLPDPEGLGAGVTVGGGPAGDSITAYVFDDRTCSPLTSAFVNGIQVNAQGKALVEPSKGAGLVTATADDHWSWSYKADAAVMYFRLQGGDGADFSDSVEGTFQLSGIPLDLDNPVADYTLFNLGQFLNSPVYIGAVFPGISRSGIFSLDSGSLMAEDTFALSYEYDGDPPETLDLPSNLYWPQLNISLDLVGLLEAAASGANEGFKVPVDSGASVNPLEGLVASITLGDALTTQTILDLVESLIGGADLIEGIMAILEPVLNNGLDIEYAGVHPNWNGTGVPDIDVVSLDAQTITVTVDNPSEDYDYFAFLLGEVGNRALVPMGLRLANDGVVEFSAASIPDGDYIVIVARTNALRILSGMVSTQVEVSFALRYADELEDWNGEIAVDNDRHFPYFTGDTAYNDMTGEVSWAVDSEMNLDTYAILLDPTLDDVYEMGVAILPGTEAEFNTQVFGEGATGYDDSLFLLGMNLPDYVDTDYFDPASILNYNTTAIAFWTNVPVYLWIPF